MIKIAIVDDEEQTREQILQTLKENYTGTTRSRD